MSAALRFFAFSRFKMSDLHIEPNASPSAYLLSLQPIREWTTSNVMEWMAAMKLYNYMDAFEKRTVSGAKLVELDEECLKVRPLLANSVAIRRSN